MLTRQAANSLRVVSDELKTRGYRLKIFDAYRPQCAVDRFVEWAKDLDDTRMKEYFYPELEKEVDMGCTYDYFGVASHPDVMPGQEVGAYQPITQQQYDNRMILRQAMLAHGFKPYDCEWWHFTLADEPYPDTYFRFPLHSCVLY